MAMLSHYCGLVTEALIGQTVTPVSYTHLDVYKRQLLADGSWREVTDHPDLAGRPRVVVAVRA